MSQVIWVLRTVLKLFNFGVGMEILSSWFFFQVCVISGANSSLISVYAVTVLSLSVMDVRKLLSQSFVALIYMDCSSLTLNKFNLVRML